ncbi:hypothetical protein D046_8812, partial [Vibrio parahaemolyticus V-223/04]
MFFIHWSNSSLWLASVSVSVEMDSVSSISLADC